MGELICRDISCRRGNFTLEIPRLSLGPGDKAALLGENGCGKTTLLQILSGILSCNGSITYRGERWDKMNARERAAHMAYLPQDPEVLFNLSVKELVELTLYEGRLFRGEARRGILEATEMDAFMERAYSSLSGGEKRRAMLARIFCAGAGLIFLDEPTSTLDMRHSALFMRMAAATAASVTAAMHDINLAVRYFNRFLLMKNGRILFDRTKDNLDTAELEEIYGIRLERRGDYFMPER